MQETLQELRGRISSTPPIRDQVYAALKDAILTNKLAPGERLVEQQLATTLGASRNPVREAFRRLEQEGYIVATRMGMCVAEVSYQDLHDLYAIRARLEGMAAALAAERASDADIARLRHILDEGERLVVQGDQARLTESSFDFHVTMYDMLNNRFLSNMLTTITEQLRRYRSLRFKIPHRGLPSIQEDRKVLEAIARHDPVQAERLAQEHVLQLWEHAKMWVGEALGLPPLTTP